MSLNWVQTVSQRAIAFGLLTIAMGCSTAPPTATSPAVTNNQTTATPTENQVQTIAIDGSSTVFPLTDEVVKEFQFERRNTPTGGPEIVVNFSGTTAGFRKFCTGETDISNASRPITQDEIALCRANGIEFVELPVALDALTVVVHPANDWADDMTLEELKTLWEPAAEGRITKWNQVRPEWPDSTITLYGPGSDSGTFDYFTEVIAGDSGESRNDYVASEDDTDLVLSIKSDRNALGYFGYAYFEENQTRLKAIAIDSGNGPVLPSTETVMDGTYQPFTRPLFIYVNMDAADSKPYLQDFIGYYLQNVRNIVQVVGYIALPDEVYNLASDHFVNRKIGSVFEGKAQPGMTVEELLQKEAAF